MPDFPDPATLAGLSAALIRIPSMPGQEASLAGFLRGWLAERGVQAWTDPAGNLLAFVPGREPGPGWMLLTHLDHVSVGDESLWTHPPFSGEVEDTAEGAIVHGRGAVDIKGPLATHAVLLAHLAASPPRRGVLLVAAAQEETTGAGAAALTAAWPPRRPGGEPVEVGAVIVGEPSNNRVMLGHRGILRLLVNLHGSAHHASFARTGENPFFALGELLRRLQARRPLPDPVLGEDSIAPTLVGVDSTSANVTPNTVTLTLDWRTVTADRSVLQRELDALTHGLDATAAVPEAGAQTAAGYHSPG
ncbi:MAG TPA: M20/M25/M40 family metallo-hydrolase, partial [Deinococcales bacterium]|nr:M20/M25/M40 family metallo-hydrolase [Deinococcales bacterium]